ncbi:hypothetical protein [Mucilaginibacter sp.]|uniref:hypothetical protein n=1 Tax=Mucilaginibacter sp. TaxID=1882438 RepID=UPI003D14BE3A
MRRHLLSGLFLLSVCFVSSAQTPIDRSIKLYTKIPAAAQVKLLNALDTLLLHISTSQVVPGEINPVDSALSRSTFNSFKGIEIREKDLHYYKPQLINLYPLKGGQYFISVAFMSSDQSSLRAIINFITVVDGDKIKFSIPLRYLTRNWKTTVTGNITYHYADQINISRAKAFDKKNKQIAMKLGLKPERLQFYLCDNYQEIISLLGCQYDSKQAGVISEGYGIDEGFIFSVMHNEDFSHDTFHQYAAIIRGSISRNSAAEEGIAYSWGNAYYTDDKGEMITQKQLMPELKQYITEHPEVKLFDLFSKGPMIFKENAKVRSLIASLISDNVERQKGVAGVKELITCGKGDSNYFSVVNKLVGINPANFNSRVMVLIDNYR